MGTKWNRAVENRIFNLLGAGSFTAALNKEGLECNLTTKNLAGFIHLLNSVLDNKSKISVVFTETSSKREFDITVIIYDRKKIFDLLHDFYRGRRDQNRLKETVQKLSTCKCSILAIELI